MNYSHFEMNYSHFELNYSHFELEKVYNLLVVVVLFVSCDGFYLCITYRKVKNKKRTLFLK